MALRKVGFSLLVFLSFVMAGYSVFMYLFSDPQSTPLMVEKLRNVDFQYEPWIYILYVHVISSVFCMLVGPFQFLPQLIRRVKLHRAFGMIYVISILFGGGSGLFLAFYANGGWIGKSGFFLLAVGWLFTTFMAMKKIRERRIQEHKRWMYRSFAFTLAAVSFRIWLAPLLFLFQGDFESAYGLTTWLCWISNLLLVEVWLRRSASREQKKVMAA